MADPDRFESWLFPTPRGLYCAPGDFHVDPHLPVDRAVISHGHSDHARPGNRAVLATPETLAIMRLRLGAAAGETLQAAGYGEAVRIGETEVRLVPAGHVLGSAQVVIEWRGRRAVVSGDYKRAADPTCPGFELVEAGLFVTEATFALPVFRHGRPEDEIARLLASLAAFPDRAHVVGVYGLGKCQRVIRLLRNAGFERPIHLNAGFSAMCTLYEEFGVPLGPLARVGDEGAGGLGGEIVLAPSAGGSERWLQGLSDPLIAFASGWMRVRARARQRGVELPLVISDHADWPELVATIAETGAGEVWITHGRDDALAYQVTAMGRRARALALVGREEEGE
ncbi:MAG: ligase-associated DNA damage response exonuclease [Hyphomicrobiaceae bacterium]